MIKDKLDTPTKVKVMRTIASAGGKSDSSAVDHRSARSLHEAGYLTLWHRKHAKAKEPKYAYEMTKRGWNVVERRWPELFDLYYEASHHYMEASK